MKKNQIYEERGVAFGTLPYFNFIYTDSYLYRSIIALQIITLVFYCLAFLEIIPWNSSFEKKLCCLVHHLAATNNLLPKHWFYLIFFIFPQYKSRVFICVSRKRITCKDKNENFHFFEKMYDFHLKQKFTLKDRKKFSHKTTCMYTENF